MIKHLLFSSFNLHYKICQKYNHQFSFSCFLFCQGSDSGSPSENESLRRVPSKVPSTSDPRQDDAADRDDEEEEHSSEFDEDVEMAKKTSTGRIGTVNSNLKSVQTPQSANSSTFLDDTGI